MDRFINKKSSNNNDILIVELYEGWCGMTSKKIRRYEITDTLYDKDSLYLRLDIGRAKRQNGRVYNNVQIFEGTKKELTKKLKELGYTKQKES